MIVPSNYANPGCGKFMPVHTDHLHVCKPCSKDEFLYTMTVDFIKECISKKKLEIALMRIAEKLEKKWPSKDSNLLKKAREEDELLEMISLCCK